MNQKGNIMKYMTFCGEINGDCASKSKIITESIVPSRNISCL